MVGLIITIIGIIVPIVLYFKKKYAAFLISIIALLTGGFKLLHADLIISESDACLLIFLVCALREIMSEKQFFTVRDDWVAMLILGLLLYSFLICSISVLLGKEQFSYGFKVFRLELFYLAYFIFRKIPIEETVKMLKWLLVISIFTGVLSYLQIVGITGIFPVDENMSQSMGGGAGIKRLTNTPTFSLLFLLYFLLKRQKNLQTFLLTIFFAGFIIFRQSRGEIIASVAALIVYFIMTGYLVRLLKVGVVFLVIGILFSSVLNQRIKETEVKAGLTFTEELERGLTLISNKDFKHVNDEGNFIFRMSIVSERLVYLGKKMNTLLFGVGTIHEDSPNNNFRFFLGSPNNGKIQAIDTNDVAFLTRVFRYGLVFLFINLALIGVMLKRLFSNRNRELIVLVAFVLLLKNLIHAMGSDKLSSLIHLFIPLLIAAQLYHHNKRLIYKHLW